MHERIVEAQKRLAIAKDHYVSAVRAIEGQYVKPLVGAGVEAEDVAALRASYAIAIDPPSEDAGDADAVDDEAPAPAPKTAKAKTPRSKKAGK